MASLGAGLPMHSAWQVTSSALQPAKQILCAEDAVAEAALAVLEAVDDPEDWAETMAARPKAERRTAENFILMVGLIKAGDGGLSY